MGDIKKHDNGSVKCPNKNPETTTSGEEYVEPSKKPGAPSCGEE